MHKSVLVPLVWFPLPTVPWEHCSWLQNVLDRHALRSITTNESPLFEQHLAAAIKEHFGDVLDQLHEADAVEDNAPEEDDTA